jgi:hypothetical protein
LKPLLWAIEFVTWDGMIRIIDESGQDYLFGEQRFVPVELPPAAEESFTKIAT